jgi:hypothetical protein
LHPGKALLSNQRFSFDGAYGFTALLNGLGSRRPTDKGILLLLQGYDGGKPFK